MKKKLTSVLLASLLFQMSLPALSYAQESQQIEQTPTSSQTKKDSSNTGDSDKKEIAPTISSSQSSEEASTGKSTESTPSSTETTVPSVSLPEVQQPQPKAGETKAVPPLTLPPGYDVGTVKDIITRQVGGEKLDLVWYGDKVPMLLNNGRTFIYSDALEITLLVNKNMTLGTGYFWNEVYGSAGILQTGYLTNRVFGHTQDSLYESFYFKDTDRRQFKMEVTQTFENDNSVNVVYTIQNLTTATLRLGVLQYMDTFVGDDSVPVTPINKFKGITLQNQTGPRLSILPEGFENWTARKTSRINGFSGYTPQYADGLGWETGFQNGDPNNPLNENMPVSLGDSAVTLKNVGKEVPPNGTISFDYVLKYEQDIAPDLTVDQSDITINKDADATITGQAWDDDTDEFKVAIVNKATNEIISSQDFTGVTLGDKQPFQLTVPADKLVLGKNEFIARVSDKWGEKKEVPVTVNVIEGQAEPSIDLTAAYQPLQSEDTTVPLNDQDAVYNRKFVTYTFKVDNTGKVDLTNSQLKALLPSSSTYVPDSTTLNDVAVADVNKESPLIAGMKVNSPGAGDGIVQPAKPAVVKMKVKVDGKPGDSLMQEGTLTGDNFTGANAVISPAITNKVKENKSAIHLKNVTVPTNSQWSPQDNFVSATDEEGKDLPFSTFTPQNNVDLSTPGTYWVQFNYDDLVVKADVTVIPATLEFVVPDTMDFQEAAISGQKQYVPRVDPDWTITVNNTLHTDWKVTAKATPMVGGAGTTYKDALVYKDSTSETSLATTTVIATGDPSQETTEMKWSKDQGILFTVDPTVMKKDSYQGTIEWTLEQAP
ncbi:bacterial Ig-like domain-containing protein [Enterococcus mundtii]|uniref:bacterial Ig-like domain-containing protein n=1 Tax=Enterococcus mundtii TaxID=53346 RepID=UPI0008263EA1|nr:bacterial Ig-like domain-containing protein [Enterococcus mundtii]